MAALDIAFEVPTSGLSICPSHSRPIDLVHLANQTMGDKGLELEVLQMFARQARRCIQEFSTGNSDIIKASAHRLKGAAMAVGAYRVTSAAEELEENSDSASQIANVGAAVLEAENFILKLCR